MICLSHPIVSYKSNCLRTPSILKSNKGHKIVLYKSFNVRLPLYSQFCMFCENSELLYINVFTLLFGYENSINNGTT